MNDDDPLLTYTEIARMLDLKVDTVRSYANRGDARFPEPDDETLGHPRWRQSTVKQWQANRPGRGRWGSRKADTSGTGDSSSTA